MIGRMVKNINTLLIIYLYTEEFFVIHLCRNQFRVLLDIGPIETTELKIKESKDLNNVYYNTAD